MRVEIAIFAKAPIAGKVKTRLSPFLNPFAACRLHKKFVSKVVDHVHSFQSKDVTLWYSRYHSFFTPYHAIKGLTLRQQCGDTLGERLAFAAKKTLMQKRACILIGSDCMDLNSFYLARAKKLLLSPKVDIIIGPATDGGYVLLGLKRFHCELFDGISWGTSTVLDETLAVAEKKSLRVAFLSELSDIDRPEDLSFLPFANKKRQCLRKLCLKKMLF